MKRSFEKTNMSEKTTSQITETLPEWAQELKDSYLAGEASQFILHTNVHDYVPFQDRFLPLRDFLYEALLSVKDIVVFYNRSEGLRFAKPEMKQKFLASMRVRWQIIGRGDFPDTLPTDPTKILPVLEQLLAIPSQNAAVIIDYAETIIPTGDLAFMGGAERDVLVTLQRWAYNPKLLESDNVVVLVTENLADIHPRLRDNPQMIPIAIPIPNPNELLAFIEHVTTQYSNVKLEMSAQRFAEISAGLSRLHIEDIYHKARQSETPISFEQVNAGKKRIIERECYGLVEIVNPDHDFSVVGGLEKIKKVLRNVADNIRKGIRQRTPMGIFFVGPMGTGKTFVAEAFAKESGLTCLKLKNFREKWVGSTEGNLEKILTIIKAMGNVLVIIDEVDRALGGESTSEGDSGTSSRVFARLKAFMSDTSNRGRIVWLVMSNRPDKLDVDMKRPGRFDKKIPFFFPESNEDREAILQALFKKNKLKHRIKDFSMATERTEGYSGADLEAIILLADEIAAEDNRKLITEDDLLEAINDFIPSRDDAMLKYMELLAVFESSSRRMLPERFQNITNEELNKNLRELRILI